MLTSWFNDFYQFPPWQMKDCKLYFLIIVFSAFEKGGNTHFYANNSNVLWWHSGSTSKLLLIPDISGCNRNLKNVICFRCNFCSSEFNTQVRRFKSLPVNAHLHKIRFPFNCFPYITYSTYANSLENPVLIRLKIGGSGVGL